jgi:hypothetical protein
LLQQAILIRTSTIMTSVSAAIGQAIEKIRIKLSRDLNQTPSVSLVLGVRGIKVTRTVQ